MFKVRITADGYEVSTDSIEDVLKVLRGGNSLPPKVTVKAAAEPEQPWEPLHEMAGRAKVRLQGSEVEKSRRRMIIRALRHLRDTKGLVHSKDMTAKTGYGNLGRFGYVVKLYGRHFGIANSEVYENRRIDRDNFWTAGPKIEQFIDALERMK